VLWLSGSFESGHCFVGYFGEVALLVDGFSILVGFSRFEGYGFVAYRAEQLPVPRVLEYTRCSKHLIRPEVDEWFLERSKEREVGTMARNVDQCKRQGLPETRRY
jgi:hypothetical protein